MQVYFADLYTEMKMSFSQIFKAAVDKKLSQLHFLYNFSFNPIDKLKFFSVNRTQGQQLTLNNNINNESCFQWYW